MSSPAPCYRFVTREQRRALFQAGFAKTLILDAASGTDAREIKGGAVTIALGPDGNLVWIDECGRLFHSGCDADPIELGTGLPVRLVTCGNRLWVLTSGKSLIQLDGSTFHLLIQQDAGGVTDIAPDVAGGVWLLARTHIRRLTDRGTELQSYPDLREAASQIAVAGDTLAALSEGATRLVIRKPDNGNGFVLDLEAMLGRDWPGKHATLSSGGNTFLVAAASTARFALIDPDGNLIVQGRWRDDRSPSLLTAVHGDLLALFEDDGRLVLKRFGRFARHGGNRILTSALETESPAGRWLSADIEATLPEGATLAMRWAATSDRSLAPTVNRILDDQNLSESERLGRADSLLPWSRTFAYLGTARDPSVQGRIEPERFTLPLHAADGPILWVDVQLRSNGAEAEPEFHSLIVFHEAEGLMDRLPAIYRGDGDRDGTLRRLVGVVEATTQGLDRGIGRLAERLDPQRTDKKWLPELAAMLGLPFHEGLPPEMVRGIVSAAAPVLAGRGTREGLLAMLRAIFPGRPARVVDLTEQLMPVALDGAAKLPALLTGPSRRVPKLNARLILSRTTLCPANACTDEAIAAPPQVLVVIAATQRERARYAEAIRSVIHEMLPIGVQLRLKWTGWTSSRHGAAEDVLAIVDAPEDLALGSGPSLGQASTGGRRSARLDSGGVIPAEHRLL